MEQLWEKDAQFRRSKGYMAWRKLLGAGSCDLLKSAGLPG